MSNCLCDFEDWRISHHAAGRILDMGLEPSGVEEAVRHPDRCWEPPSYPGRRNHLKGEFTVALSVTQGVATVVTTLWATNEAWQADFDRASYADRERRADFRQRP